MTPYIEGLRTGAWRLVGSVKVLPTQAVLAEIFDYDPLTGRLFRKALDARHFQSGSFANRYNSRNAGKEAFTFQDPRGYRKGKVLGVDFQAHRVIWKLCNGDEPPQIDHINGNPSDNRLSNLRAATNAENSRNYRKRKAGSSRYHGVCWVKRDEAWAARISDGNGGKISLGNYHDETAAARAYDGAALKMHGAFATLNFPEDYR